MLRSLTKWALKLHLLTLIMALRIVCSYVTLPTGNHLQIHEEVMKLVQPRDIGLSDAVILTIAKIVDHLTPSTPELFAAAKSFRE